MLIAERIRRIREQHEAGVTLMELVVAMSLTTIIGAMALSFFLGMGAANSTTIDANVATASARSTIQDWSSLLQLADSPSTPGASAGRLERVTPTDIVFYANLDNRSCQPDCTARSHPTKIELALRDGQLVEYRYSYRDGAYSAQPTSTRYQADDASATGWLFTPYIAGNPPSAALPALCSNGTAAGICDDTPAGQAMLDSIVRIDITFTVTDTQGKHPQTFTSSAALTGSTA